MGFMDCLRTQQGVLWRPSMSTTWFTVRPVLLLIFGITNKACTSSMSLHDSAEDSHICLVSFRNLYLTQATPTGLEEPAIVSDGCYFKQSTMGSIFENSLHLRTQRSIHTKSLFTRNDRCPTRWTREQRSGEMISSAPPDRRQDQ